jgi:hypothetical protein
MRAVTERDKVSSGCSDSLIDCSERWNQKHRTRETKMRTSLSVCSASRSALIRVRVSVRDVAILLEAGGVIGSSIVA